jgi:hypothetical protein
VLAFSSLAGPSLACSCERSPDGGVRAPTAAQVFVGRVLSMQRVSVTDDAVASQTLATNRLSTSVLNAYMRVCFAIERVEKGLPMSSVCVGTGFGGGDCGFPFVVGERYRVFAHRNAHETSWELGLETGICDETRPLG